MKRLFVIGGILAGLTFVLLGSGASALSYRFPDEPGPNVENPLFLPGDSQADASLLLIKRGGSYQLNVPRVSARVFVNGYSSGSFRVYMQPVTCDAGSSIRVTPKFIPPGDHTTLVDGPAYNLACGAGGGTTVFDANNMGTNSKIYGDIGYKVGQVDVELTSGPGTRFEFRLVTDDLNSFVTFAETSFETSAYAGPTDPFAISRSQFANLGNDYDGYDFAFTVPSCYPYEGFFLRWTDDDQGAGNQPAPISFDLYDQTTNRLVTTEPAAPQWGGDSDSIRYVYIRNSTVLKGHKLIWRWRNVYRTNGIQIIVPFSQIYLENFDCGDPGGYEHQALIDCTTDAGSGNVRPGTIIECDPGMANVGSRDGPVTAVELYEYTQQGRYTEQASNPVPGPAYDARLSAYYGYLDSDMYSGDGRQPHYAWLRSDTPNATKPYNTVQYQNVRYRVRAGTPAGTRLCFGVKVTANPGNADRATVSSRAFCYVVGVPPDDNPVESCPAPALPNGNPMINVTLPDQSPNSPLSPLDNPWGLRFTLERNATYYQDIRQNKTRVVSIGDISTGGVPIAPTLVPGSDVTYQQATLNYTPYVREYPYDFNQPSVTYDAYYNRTTWRSSASPDGYLCDDGWQLENNRGPDCLNYYPAESYYTCPGGWNGPTLTGYGYLCSRPNSHSANSSTSYYYYCPGSLSGPYLTGFGYLCKDRFGNWAGGASRGSTTTYSCPHADDSQSGSTCTHTDWQPANGPYYRCPNGGVVFNGGGFGMLCQRRRAGTPFYNWRNAGTENDRTTRSTTTNTYRMSPCYRRTYDAYPVAGTASLTPDPESPTQSSFTGQINVNFGVASTGGRTAMRERSRVDLPYTISYYIQRANGGRTSDTDVNRSTTITANNYNKTSNGSDSMSHSISVSVPGVLQVGDRVCWTLYTTRRAGQSQTTGEMDTNGTIQSGNGRREAGDCTARVHNQPYVRVYGGDIMAGSGFGVGCSINTNAAILGWNRGNGAGSAVQYAAQAAGAITDVSSATLRANPGPPKGLSFSNNTGNTTYGGAFGSGSCAKDYFAMANPANIETSYPNSAADYNVPRSARQAVYINGDAFIRRNVLYTGTPGAADAQPWASLSEIPSYYLIVRGNIYISENVSRLDGVYIAQPRADGTGGRIYTCVDHGTMAVRTTSPEAFTRCQTKLTVNGAFMAKQIRFLRTNGSLRDSSPGEVSTSGTIAEVFNYSPELFLVDPGLSATPARQYDSASGLPPVL